MPMPGNRRKVKIELDQDIVKELHSMKELGESYSDILRKLLKVFHSKG